MKTSQEEINTSSWNPIKILHSAVGISSLAFIQASYSTSQHITSYPNHQKTTHHTACLSRFEYEASCRKSRGNEIDTSEYKTGQKGQYRTLTSALSSSLLSHTPESIVAYHPSISNSGIKRRDSRVHLAWLNKLLPRYQPQAEDR